MKLILAIAASEVLDTVTRALVEHNYPVTQISSMGGFLRRGSTTLMIGVDAPQVAGVLTTIRAAVPTTPRANNEHYVTLFVLDAAQFVQV